MQVCGPGADKGGRGGHKSQAVAQKDLMLLGKSCVLYDLTTQLASCSLVTTVALHDLHMREWRPIAPGARFPSRINHSLSLSLSPVSGCHRIIPPSRVFGGKMRWTACPRPSSWTVGSRSVLLFPNQPTSRLVRLGGADEDDARGAKWCRRWADLRDARDVMH